MDNYSISELITNLNYFVRTRMFYRQCRFIRFPFYLRGRKSLNGGNGLTLGRFCRFELEGNRNTLIIGNNCEFGDNTHIVALNSVDIGNDVLLASKCFISDTSHGRYTGIKQDSPHIKPNQRKLISGSVKIGNNVWIGENAVILPDTEIGHGCVIGANSVVRGIFPKNCIIVGAPAKIVKKYNEKLQVWERIKKEE